MIAASLSPKIKPYLIASHQSAEPRHKIVLNHLGLKPLLNLDLRLGEGTGSALGIFLVEAALKILNEMATFEEAGVSKKYPNNGGFGATNLKSTCTRSGAHNTLMGLHYLTHPKNY